MKKLISLTLGILCSIKSFAGAGSGFNNDQSFCFTENKGQITDQYLHYRNDIQFRLSTHGMNVFIGNGQLHYQWVQSSGDKNNIYRLDVQLEGARIGTPVITEHQVPGYNTYYLPQCTNGVTAYSYNKVTYRNVYPNIDWSLYIKDNQLKYDFIVHPGGDPANIKLTYAGTTKLSLDNGAVKAETPVGSITENKPYTYDAETGNTIQSAFIQNGNTISFKTGTSTNTMVIDPALTLNWATYYGDSLADESDCIATDFLGNVVMGGYTYNTVNIATTGAHSTTLSGSKDAFIVKFNATGTRQWATYYGGTGNGITEEIFKAATFDVNGNVYACGTTGSSSSIATSGAHQSAYGGGSYDAFLVKFSAAGARQWATYYGGSSNEDAVSICGDVSGNIYIAGWSWSASGIASAGAYQATYDNSLGTFADGYFAKFNSSGVRQWGTYYGGSENDYIWDIKCNITGNIFIAGNTNSASAIASPGAYQSAYSGISPMGKPDGFIAKFNSTVTRQWGTYVGGSQYDYVNSIATDISGNLFFGGSSQSSGLATTGAYQSSYGGNNSYDGILGMLNSSGAIQWFTYLGQSQNDEIKGIAANVSGDVYLSKTTSSAPLAIMRFNAAGAKQDSITLTNAGICYKGMAYAGNNLFITGDGGTGIATPGAYQVTNKGGGEIYLACYSTGEDTLTVINKKTTNNHIIAVYPNPSKGIFTLHSVLQNNNTGSVTIEIANATGEIVYKSTEAITNGTLNRGLRLDVPDGIYILRLRSGDEIQSVKLIIQ